MRVKTRAVVFAASLVVCVVPLGTAQAGDDPLGRAHDVAEHLDFNGRLMVSWPDRTGPHRAELVVTSHAGVIDIEGAGGVRGVVADPRGRLVNETNGWTLLWPPGDPLSQSVVPKLLDKYEMRKAPGPTVAGRTTTAVTLSTAGAVREVDLVDIVTGLDLGRTVFNADGSIVRDVRFETLNFTSVVGNPPPVVAHRRVDLPTTRLEAPFEAPPTLAAGYRRVGVFRNPDGVHVLYSDGVDSLSVFEVPGSLKSGLPRGAVVTPVGRHNAFVWTEPGSQVVTWQDGAAIYTVVGDGPLTDLVAAGASLPKAPELSWSQRVRHACHQMVTEFTGW